MTAWQTVPVYYRAKGLVEINACQETVIITHLVDPGAENDSLHYISCT